VLGCKGEAGENIRMARKLAQRETSHKTNGKKRATNSYDLKR